MKRIAIFFLTLSLAALACVVQAQASISAPTALLTPTPNAVLVVLPTPKDTPNALVIAQVTANEALHVRNEPLGIVIGYLYAADTVTLAGSCQSGWAQIIWEGSRAWVNADYLSDNKCKE